MAGAIVNMSSVNAVLAIPSITPYCVAKGGVNQLTTVMALALANKGIRVNAVGPGSINPEMVRAVTADPAAWSRLMSRTPIRRLSEPEETGHIALIIAPSQDSSIPDNTTYSAGGQTRLHSTMPQQPP